MYRMCKFQIFLNKLTLYGMYLNNELWAGPDARNTQFLSMEYENSKWKSLILFNTNFAVEMCIHLSENCNFLLQLY